MTDHGDATQSLGFEGSIPSMRFARRALGITQAQLAERLGVRQATVSRWESGYEEIPKKRQLQMIDLFTNRRDAIHPILDRLIRRGRDVTINSKSWTFLRTSHRIQNAFELGASEMDGRPIEVFFSDEGTVASREITWQSNDLGPLLFAEAEGDVTFRKRNSDFSTLRVHNRYFNVALDNHTRVWLSQVLRVSPATGRPTVSHGAVRLGQLAM